MCWISLCNISLLPNFFLKKKKKRAVAFLPICVKPWQAFARCRPADVAPERGRWSRGGRSASCPSLTRDSGAHSPATPRFRGSRSLPAGAGVGVRLLSLCFRSFSPARAWIAAWPCLLDCWRILHCSLLESLFIYIICILVVRVGTQTCMCTYIYTYMHVYLGTFVLYIKSIQWWPLAKMRCSS